MTKISPSRSFEGFDIIKLLKGQKKPIIAGIGYLIGLLTSNNEIIASGSALAFSIIISALEFYFKRVDMREH